MAPSTICLNLIDTPLKEGAEILVRTICKVAPITFYESLKSREKFLNWIEIRRVWRQIDHFHASIGTHLRYPFGAVKRRVIHWTDFGSVPPVMPKEFINKDNVLEENGIL
ncbi:hypothetical protein N7530_012748 [Penicillium desertorum]|uniref:Uncharacterized protein n=1 Tax=Penicillium desertorum TaxID=1303715 RepID=A0A9W9WDC1_9EURO|nr:hypothetical protein N7530_012748 [Penicillium desertorum]